MKHLLFLDIETTGLSAEKDELIELSAIRVSSDFNKQLGIFDELTKPNQEISPFITRLTGISNEMVSTAPSLEEIHEDFKKFLRPSDVICGHNIMFDIGFLRAKGFDIPNEHLDTFPLSNILLPNEPSYSLEILTKKFEIEHENAHRALADVEANLELFKELLKIAHHLDPKLQYEYAALLKKSNWTGNMLFDAAFDEKVSKSQSSKTSKSESQTSLFDFGEKSKESVGVRHRQTQDSPLSLQEKRATNMLEESFLEPDSQVLLSFPPETRELSVATTCAQKIVQTNEKEKIFVSISGNKRSKTPEGFYRYASPEKVICERAFEKWKESRDTFTEGEVVTAMKLVREMHAGESLILSDLPMMREEWSIAKKWISDDHIRCSSECPAKKMQLESAQKNLFFCHVSDAGSCPAKKGIVLHGSQLAKSLEKATHETMPLRGIKKSLEEKKNQEITEGIFFGIGLLERFVREQVGESPYREYLTLSADLLNTPDVKNLSAGFLEAKKQCTLHFPEDRGLQENLGKLAAFLSDEIPENQCRFLAIYQDDNIFISTADISLIPSFEQNFCTKEKVIFTGKAFLQRGGKYLFGESLPVPDKQKTLESSFAFAEKSLFCVPSHGGNGKTADCGRTLETVEKILPDCNGNLLVLFPGGNIAENFITGIAEVATENGFQVLGIHGSAGKLTEKMKGKKSIVVATSGNWQKVNFADLHFVGCVQHRLIFDPPADPAGRERNKDITDTFLELALPKAVQKAVYLLGGLSAGGNSFFWLCLDSHFQKTGNFTEEILAALPIQMPVQKIGVDEMVEEVIQFLNKQ